MKYTFFIFLNLGVVVSQNCQEYGKMCNDDKACCGGCCILVYADCRVHSSACSNFPCPAGQDCYLYQPDYCEGCASYPQCKESPQAPFEITAVPSFFSENAAGNNQLYPFLYSLSYLILCITIL
ncbi:uncharacterized protein LOC130898550 isoform X2 [Diorhabda carinulata]|uniref:uncharacterized protein LOC130898550 isoform X2 n=1 Tax=Diorhabda carinulata TaxID=1163345 RepID=UPI0025A10EDA|nr:uncharacterized protein LOC130898550 isoform X2 [Diorhabda carinulata]